MSRFLVIYVHIQGRKTEICGFWGLLLSLVEFVLYISSFFYNNAFYLGNKTRNSPKHAHVYFSCLLRRIE